MKSFNKTAAAIAISLALGVVAVAYAQPGQMHGKMEHGAQAGMQHDMKDRMKQGMNRDGGKPANRGEAKGHGEHDSQAAQSLATPEERSAMHDRMRAAKTPEERQQIATSNHAEMQKRAAEKGITLPEHRGPQGRGTGPNAGHTH